MLAPVPSSAAAGFFDGLPRRGTVVDDVSYLVNRAGAGVAREPVATIRYLRLVLDPGTRDQTMDLWPEREMLLVQHASGERIAFERIVRPPRPRTPEDSQPRGRVGLEGAAVELFTRGEGAAPERGRPQVCAGSFTVLVAGGRDLSVAPEDLEAPTVREGIARFLDAALGEKQRELVTRSVQIALRAGKTRALPLASLDILKTLFPGRPFDPWPEALVFDTSTKPALDPAQGEWRTVTEAPEMSPGPPLY